jgi:hypothetical protein
LPPPLALLHLLPKDEHHLRQQVHLLYGDSDNLLSDDGNLLLSFDCDLL